MDNDKGQRRRHPLAKEHFFEGNRQRWAGIFTAIGLLVMLATSYGWIKDPAPFLQFFLSIGVTFILGASATAVMNSWKVNSQTATLDETQSRTEELNENQTTTEKIERPRACL
jgi:hypothetical protein